VDIKLRVRIYGMYVRGPLTVGPETAAEQDIPARFILAENKATVLFVKDVMPVKIVKLW
jgi:ferric-dicitrate binding protein FerR (iron transport regulator)